MKYLLTTYLELLLCLCGRFVFSIIRILAHSEFDAIALGSEQGYEFFRYTDWKLCLGLAQPQHWQKQLLFGFVAIIGIDIFLWTEGVAQRANPFNLKLDHVAGLQVAGCFDTPCDRLRY